MKKMIAAAAMVFAMGAGACDPGEGVARHYGTNDMGNDPADTGSADTGSADTGSGAQDTGTGTDTDTDTN